MTKMKADEMSRQWEDLRQKLRDISLEGSSDWIKANTPQALTYFETVKNEIFLAIGREDAYAFSTGLQKYEKGWRKIWMLMAKEHVATRPFDQVDMRYYRFLSSKNRFIMKSGPLKRTITVFASQPTFQELKDIKGDWMTAQDLLDIHECPIILGFMKTFGAWYDKEPSGQVSEREKEASYALSISEAKRKIAEGKGLKLKRQHKGWSHFE